MRLVLVVAAIICLLAGFGFTGEPPKAAKTFEVTNIFGRTYSIDFERTVKDKKPVILHVWGPWCGPCVREFPAFLRFADERDGTSPWFVAVSVNSSKDELYNFMRYLEYHKKAHNLFMTIGSEEDIIFADDYYDVGSFPTTLLIDGEGNIMVRLEGTRNWASPRAKEVFNLFVAGSPVPEELLKAWEEEEE